MKMILILVLSFSSLVYGKVSILDLKEYCNYYKYDNCTLVQAIVQKESGYNELSYHPEKTGSYGLMQIQCELAKRLGLKYGCYQLFNPKINIRFGILYLKSLEEKMIAPIDIKEVLSIYNGGQSRHVITIGKKRFIKAKPCSTFC